MSRAVGNAEYYQRNRPRLLKRAKAHYRANKTRVRKHHRDGRMNVVRPLLKFQGGCCAVCLEWLGGKQKNLDHEHSHCKHSTNYVRGCQQCWRGVLCNACNLLIGLAEKRNRLDLLSAVVKRYLRNPPFQRMMRRPHEQRP